MSKRTTTEPPSDDADRYSNHQEQLDQAQPPSGRLDNLENALRDAFSHYIVERTVGFIQFDQISAEELGQAFVNYPIIVKSVLACVNVAGRALARDLNLSVDTYGERIGADKAFTVAGYVKPMLPREIAIPALTELDRWFWVDKRIRATKGSWEKRVTDTLNESSDVPFRKRKFTCDGEKFELDAGHPAKGDHVKIGIDVKRIESPRDIHKRTDEIINKAAKFKKVYPDGKFFAVVYYPFPTQ